jgi:hypothetical protein
MTKNTRKLVITNISLVLGCVLAAIFVPRQTTVTVFAAVCLVAIVAVNAVLAISQSAQSRKPAARAAQPAQSSSLRLVVFVILFLVSVAVTIAVRRGHAH